MSAAAICAVKIGVGQGTQIDLELPANQELQVVLVDIGDYLSKYLEDSGAPDSVPDSTWGWRLRTPLGTALDNTKSLADQGVTNGARLTLVSGAPVEDFAPRIENVSAAVADASERLFPRVTPTVMAAMLTRLAAGFAATATAVLIAAALIEWTWPTRGAAWGAAALWLAAGALNARRWHKPVLTDPLWAGALVFVPAAGSLVVGRHWGGPNLLVAGAAVAALAVIGLGTRRRLALFSALVVIGSAVTFSQAWSAHTLLPGPVVCCVLMVAVVILLGRVEIDTQRLVRMPRPTFPSGSGRFVGRRAASGKPDTLEPAGAPPDPAALLTRSVNANHMVSGLLAGLAVTATAVVAVTAATHPQSWPWLVFCAGVPTLFAYRVWSFVGRANIGWLLAGVFGPAVALIVVLAVTHGMWWGAGAAGVVTVLAAVAPLTIPTGSQAPLVRGARVISEYVVTLAVLLAPVLLLHLPQMVYNRDFG
ncbi:MAG: type VII secretion integral membrane protein EccD [Mycolicibacterium sp.]|uniref:type VII secretion integral membrane protein EccD n=1 Tax=Mycolicibacterium sp. TaxID=2320850 RepID=UPI003D13ADF7